VIEEKDDRFEKADDQLEEASDQTDEVKEKILLAQLIADYRGATKHLLELVKDALKEGSDVNDDSRNDHRPLQLAIQRGHPEVACLLIEAGADLNYRDKSWFDPIHTAINHGQFEVAKLLIKKGVHFNRCIPDLTYNYSNWYRFCFGG